MQNKTEGDAPEPATVEALFEDLRAVVRDAEALLRATEGEAGEKIAEIRARAAQSLHAARERLDEAGAGVGERARSAARSTDAYVHENPWAAVAIAAGIGFLVGSLGRRR
jgi:ElaB/YqjD/DUF883 family membrane-anchored ribosome-binding protein